MDIKVFQEKLREITDAAKMQKEEFTRERIQQFFGGEKLEDAQIEKIQAYLRAQGAGAVEIREEEIQIPEERPAALSPDEQQYLRDYEESL